MLTVSAPPSKSYTQRALVAAFLAEAPTRLINPLVADDTRVPAEALTQLGATIERHDDAWRLTPPARLLASREPLSLGNSGASLRFLMALALLLDGPTTLTGDAALRRRPSPGLVAALRQLGAQVDFAQRPDCPPLTITPPTQPAGRRVTMDPTVSGQQVSALLLVAPRLPHGLRLDLTAPPPSTPYLEMTIAVLQQFGATVTRPAQHSFDVAPAKLACAEYRVEGDHSAAAFLHGAAYLLDKSIRVEGLRADSLQGDCIFPQLLDELRLGRQTFELRDTPDLVPPLVACTLFADRPVDLRGVAHLRYKESDRLRDYADELRKIGAVVAASADSLHVEPLRTARQATLNPHGDHRLAMAFGLIALRVPSLEILDRGCVGKSFPGFWECLRTIATAD